MITPIRLVPLHPVSDEIVQTLVAPIASVFRTEVSIEQPLHGVINAVYDLSRGQYNSTDLIRILIQEYGNMPTKVLGIVSVDLFVPILTYVFGEAQLDGSTGVMSTYRLDDAVYGLQHDPVLMFERCLKESVHELGHTYGLLHCKNFDCAMHASTTVDDIDLKGAGLCENCLQQIGAA
ncbi:MAG: archaemetzincin family Zn-dependent metalloprotease [Bacteroidota bacterium]